MMINKFLSRYVVSLALLLGFSSIGFAQTAPSPEKFPNIDIINFGQMDDRFYRGGQPEPDDYQALKDLGVKTVVDLRNDPTDYEKAAVEALGMKYVNIPMTGWKYPKDRHIDAFKQVMNDPETGVMFVHCKAGKHRTGVVGAVYRYENYGWNYEKAYKEMKNYNYTKWLVHGLLKTFVKDYYRDDKRRIDNIALSLQTANQAGN